MSEAGRYLRPIFKYLKSKGLTLFLLALGPSFLAAFLISPSSLLYFLCDYFELENYRFTNVFTRMFNFNSEFYYVGIIGLVLFIFVIAILFGIIDRHMRIGDFTLNPSKVKKRINYNFLTALKLVLVGGVVFELYNLLNAFFAVMWAGTFDSLIASFVFSLVTFAILTFLLLLLFTSMILWCPFMLHTGMGTGEALHTAFRQNSRNVKRLAGIMTLALLPLMLIMLLSALLGWGMWVRIVLDGTCLAVLTVVYLVAMYTVFYDVTGVERLDLQIVDIWSKKKGV
jgi:hypothetical protein